VVLLCILHVYVGAPSAFFSIKYTYPKKKKGVADSGSFEGGFFLRGQQLLVRFLQ
jgi:hypothetical protein